MKKISILIFIAIFFNSCNSCEDWIRENVPYHQYSGQVVKKYKDSKNRESLTVLFMDNSIEIVYSIGLYNNIQAGDSIIKNKGTLKYLLIRGDSTMVFYPNCRLKLIKDGAY